MFLTALVKAPNKYTFQNILEKEHPRREFSREFFLLRLQLGLAKL
jgi:hypothetical protein